MKDLSKYKVESEKIENSSGYWNSLKVKIFENDKQIGEYLRKYHTLFDTFIPFYQGDKEYALYSDDYTKTKVMELPSCKEICSTLSGFCPTGYYVPYIDDDILNWSPGKEYDPYIGPNGMFGFVCGCYWGDDSSWKIEFLDLSKISQGVIKQDDRFGYIELFGDSSTLKDSIIVEDYTQKEYDNQDIRITIAHAEYFNIVKRELNLQTPSSKKKGFWSKLLRR